MKYNIFIKVGPIVLTVTGKITHFCELVKNVMKKMIEDYCVIYIQDIYLFKLLSTFAIWNNVYCSYTISCKYFALSIIFKQVYRYSSIKIMAYVGIHIYIGIYKNVTIKKVTFKTFQL